MKILSLALAASLLALPVSAGNLGTFVAPDEVAADPAPMGGSAAGWVVPLLAVLVIAAIASSSGDDEPETNVVITPPELEF